MERRCYELPATIEERDGAPARISGHASVFYDGTPATEYRFGDTVERILPTAFDFALTSSDVRALFNHDPSQIIGRSTAGTLLLSKDQRGLAYSILPPDGPVGVHVRDAIRRGDVTGSSFSFTVSKKGQTWTRLDDGTYLREIRSVDQLYDVGPVTFPAYSGSTTGLRSSGGETEDFTEFKRAIGEHRNQAARRAAELRAIELEMLR
jgi:HK97 family phage prohead protease